MGMRDGNKVGEAAIEMAAKDAEAEGRHKEAAIIRSQSAYKAMHNYIANTLGINAKKIEELIDKRITEIISNYLTHHLIENRWLSRVLREAVERVVTQHVANHVRTVVERNEFRVAVEVKQ